MSSFVKKALLLKNHKLFGLEWLTVISFYLLLDEILQGKGDCPHSQIGFLGSRKNKMFFCYEQAQVYLDSFNGFTTH